MTKTLNQIIFFSSTKIRIFFSATLGIRIFFHIFAFFWVELQKPVVTPILHFSQILLQYILVIFSSYYSKYLCIIGE